MVNTSLTSHAQTMTSQERPSECMLDFCKIVHGLARNPIVDTLWYTELSDDLTFEHVIRNGEVSTTLGEFCAMLDTPFKIVVVRTYPYGRVRDDREWYISKSPGGRLIITDQHII